MCDNLISLLNESIDVQNEEIKSLSIKINDIKKVYDTLIPNKNKRNVIKAERIKDKKVFYQFIELICKYNIILYNKILMLDKEIKIHEKQKISLLSATNLFLTSNIIQAKQYNQAELTKMQEKENQIRKSIEQMLSYSFSYVVNLYENLENDKEKQKELKKNYEYALEHIISKSTLSTRDISVITNMINDSLKTLEEKDLIFDELNRYIVETKKDKMNSLPTKQEVKEKTPAVYIDDSMDNVLEDEKEEANCYYNYIIAIKSFDSYKDINTFLESIKFSCDIYKIIENVINLLDDSKEDNLLKEYLEKYLSDMSNKDDAKEPENNDITIFYHGFLEKKNRILSDISKSDIPKEFYNDVLEAINMIKTGDTKNKIARIDSIRKVLKLRYKDIRITYKKLSNNIYIILGIFCKKDSKGYNVINKTRKRDKILSMQEKNIIDAMKIPELWDEYLKENSIMEEQIISLLSNKIK